MVWFMRGGEMIEWGSLRSHFRPSVFDLALDMCSDMIKVEMGTVQSVDAEVSRTIHL